MGSVARGSVLAEPAQRHGGGQAHAVVRMREVLRDLPRNPCFFALSFFLPRIISLFLHFYLAKPSAWVPGVGVTSGTLEAACLPS